MPFKTPTAALKNVQRGLMSMATPEGDSRVLVLKSVDRNIKTLFKTEFAKGESSEGTPWTPTKRGKQALLSRKLPYVFVSRIDRGILGFVGRTARDWITAQHEGHTFPARNVARGVVKQRRDGKGRLISAKRLSKLVERRMAKGIKTKRRYSMIGAAAHRVGQRQLPARPIIPVGNALPPPWDAAVKAGVAVGMQQWSEKVTR